MAGSNLFRTAMIGGYNKQDVNEYVQTLEYEIEAIKRARQEDRKKWEEQADSSREQQEVEVPLLKEEIQRLQEELSRLQQEKSGKDAVTPEEQEKVPGPGEKEPENQEMGGLREDLERLREENRRLREENQELVRTGKNPDGKEEGLFSYGTVKKIMEDAHKNADLIRKEAKQKAELIVKEAEEEAERQKELIVDRINAQLDEKGIQLIAAKYKIEQYLKEVHDASQALQDVYSHMSQVLDKMPTRIDNYWEGDYQKMMARSRRGIGVSDQFPEPMDEEEKTE